MGNITSEGLENIGSIDEKGYIYNSAGDCIASINDSGYINKLGGLGNLGKIDPDGTIRDSMSNVIGRVQADGDIIIHSQRVGHLDSAFIAKITPKAWDAGHINTYASGREASPQKQKPEFNLYWPFGTGTTIKLILGVILGIVFIIMGASSGSLSFGVAILAIPFGIAAVFFLTFIIKLFNGG